MVIFLIVTGSIYGVLRVAQRSRSVVSEQVQLTKSVRRALNLVGRDTYNAGYGYPLKNTVALPDNRIAALLVVPGDADTTRDTVPPIIAGNNVTLNNFNGTSGALTDQVTFLFKDTTFNVVGTGDAAVSQPLYINNPQTNSSGIDEIVPVTGSTNASCSVNDIFLITGKSSATLGVVTALSGSSVIQFANGDSLNINLSGASGELSKVTTPASLLRIIMVTYFVSTDGTLTRRVYANAPVATPAVAFVDEPLVYGVENFQIQYILDDGAISNNPSAGPNGTPGDGDDDQNKLAAIRQIRFTVNARSIELNSAGQPYRVTMNSTFSTRNLGYDAN